MVSGDFVSDLLFMYHFADRVVQEVVQSEQCVVVMTLFQTCWFMNHFAHRIIQGVILPVMISSWAYDSGTTMLTEVNREL